jgi:hypothetical protein
MDVDMSRESIGTQTGWAGQIVMFGCVVLEHGDDKPSCTWPTRCVTKRVVAVRASLHD